jgi:cell wall-associated NlpC family hydrolase
MNKLKILKRSICSMLIILVLIFAVCIMSLFVILSGSNKHTGGYNTNLNGVPEEFIPYFNEASELFNMPNWNLAAIAKQESNFDPKCAYGGAWGIMQIQKQDFDGSDIWKYYMDLGLGNIYKSLGYSFSSSDEMWQIYLDDPRAQIIAGGYEIRQYTNYVLKRKGLVEKLDYNSNENMNLIPWTADENDSTLLELLRRSYACYNGGPGYGMKVDLDHAQNNYPNQVYKYAMEFRSTGLVGGDVGLSDNDRVNAIIDEAMKYLGVPYKWGGESPSGFDCSGLIKYSIQQVTGVSIQRTANEQMNACQSISFEDLEPGDLVFRVDSSGSAKHVQLYIGDGKVIHAPQTGDVVKISPVPHKDNNRYGRHPIMTQP